MDEKKPIIDLSIGGHTQSLEDLKEMGDYDDSVQWAKWNANADTGLVRK